MTPPPTIPFSSIQLGERGRTQYCGIEELAQLILDNGLIQPVVLVLLNPTLGDVAMTMCNGDLTDSIMLESARLRFGLDAGGRRYHALKLLLSRGDWDGTLHYATTSERDPLRPGYVLKGEFYTTPLERCLTEIAENLGRENLDWLDELKLIVKAYRLSQQDAHAKGEHILMSDFGHTLGVGFQDLRAAVAIHDDVIAQPERYKDCTSIRGALAKLLKINDVELTKIVAKQSLAKIPRLPKIGEASSSVSIQTEPGPIAKNRPTIIDLSSAFNNCDSLIYMKNLSGPTFDHIITDPDYGVSIERLNANMEDAGVGVAQASVGDSLSVLFDFITLSWKCIKDQGFLIFWYDLDHHEKLKDHATAVGFRNQRWPLIWHKTDTCSNADPAHNFPKNFEYAMVCRKPNAVLAQVQKTSIFQCATGTTTRDFSHPFAKPLDVWKWLYGAVTIKGQVVYDPFLGSGSSAVAAIQYGLKPVGSELDEGHYANAIMNLQREFKVRLDEKVVFS